MHHINSPRLGPVSNPRNEGGFFHFRSGSLRALWQPCGGQLPDQGLPGVHATSMTPMRADRTNSRSPIGSLVTGGLCVARFPAQVSRLAFLIIFSQKLLSSPPPRN